MMLKALVTGASLLATFWYTWIQMGGRLALRNRRIRIAAAVAISAVLVLFGLVITADNRPVSDWLVIGAAALFLIALMSILRDGLHPRHYATKFLGEFAEEFRYGSPDDDESAQLGEHIGAKNLRKLRALIAPMGVAPGYDWLTVGWIDAQLKELEKQRGRNLLGKS